MPSLSRLVTIWTKADVTAAQGKGLHISALTGEGLDSLLRCVEKELDLLNDGTEPPVVTHDRQIRLLATTLENLASMETDEAVELLAEHLRRASQSLAHLAGSVDVEDVLGQIFSTFCIGK